MRRRKGRDLGVVIRGRDLDAIHAYPAQVDQLLEQREHLVACHSAGLRRARAGRKGRVKAVDVQAQVDGRLAVRGQTLANLVAQGGQLGRALEAAQVARREDQPAAIANVLSCGALARRADADLREAGIDDQAFLHRLAGPGAENHTHLLEQFLEQDMIYRDQISRLGPMHATIGTPQSSVPENNHRKNIYTLSQQEFAY